jgi:hypothetical protein
LAQARETRHDSNPVEIEARRVRRASRRHEQLLPSKFTAISRDHELVLDLFLFSFCLFFLANGDRMHLRKDLDLDALGDKRRLEQFADQRVFVENSVWRARMVTLLPNRANA